MINCMQPHSGKILYVNTQQSLQCDPKLYTGQVACSLFLPFQVSIILSQTTITPFSFLSSCQSERTPPRRPLPGRPGVRPGAIHLGGETRVLCMPERRQSTRAEAGEESLINGGAARTATISSSSPCDATSERRSVEISSCSEPPPKSSTTPLCWTSEPWVGSRCSTYP